MIRTGAEPYCSVLMLPPLPLKHITAGGTTYEDDGYHPAVSVTPLSVAATPFGYWDDRDESSAA
jgi:hypothetical protein